MQPTSSNPQPDFTGILPPFANGNPALQFFGFDFFAPIFDLLLSIWNVYSIIAFILSAILIYGIIYSYLRDIQLGDVILDQVRQQEQLYQEIYGGTRKNSRFDDVERHLESNNPNDWKLAIIEADIMLDDMLDNAGYAGATIGEKLKSASPTSFRTLDDAWKAHRVRNQIAHEGADFVLTQKVAQETIVMYRKVFQEFGVM